MVDGDLQSDGQGSETSASSQKDRVASKSVFLITLSSEISWEVTPEDNDKVDESESTHDDTVECEIKVEFQCEDLVEGLGRLVHGILGGRLETQSQSWGTGSEGVDPKSGDWRKGEDRVSIFILECQSDHEDNDFSNVTGKQVEQEFGQISEDGSTFSDSSTDGSEIVIGKNEVGRLLGDIRSCTHTHTDIGSLQCRRVVDTITSHDGVLTPSVNSVDHSDLGLGSTSSDDKWQVRQVIDLLVGQGVELLTSHDGSLVVGLVNDTNRESDSSSGSRVITSQHSRSDTSSPTVGNGTGRFLSWRIKDTSETEERETLFEIVSSHGFDLVGIVTRHEFTGKTEDSETLLGESVHLLEDVVLSLFVEIATNNLFTSVQDSLDGTLEETDNVWLLVGSSLGNKLVGDRHSLDRGIEWVLDNQFVMTGNTSDRGSVRSSRWLSGEVLVVLLVGKEGFTSTELVSSDLESDLGRVTVGLPSFLGSVKSSLVTERST